MQINFFGIRLRKNKYELLRFFNRRHGKVFCLTLALIGYLGTLYITRSKALAKNSYDDLKNDDFKIAFRRAAKLLYIYKNKKIARDDTFNFCEGLKKEALEDLKEKFEEISHETTNLSFEGDYLYVLGGLIELGGDFIKEFENISNRILKIASHSWREIDGSDDKITHTPKVSRPIAKINPAHAHSALSEWSKLFPPSKMQWFLVSGTFLGLIRDGGFIEHDYDIDFGIFDSDFELNTLKSKINNSKNFFIKKIDLFNNGTFINGKFHPETDKKPVLVKIIHRSGLNIDLFIHFKENVLGKNSIWHGSSYHKWVNSEFDLKDYIFIDIPVLGPDNPDTYLTENYGDWRTPVTEFHFNTGTPNLSLHKNPTSLALFIKRISEFRSANSYSKNFNVLISNKYISDTGHFSIHPTNDA